MMRFEPGRPGFTLIEALLSGVIAAVLFAAAYRTVIMQQQSYRQQAALVDSRRTTRASLELLAVELRNVSATGGDLLLATEDSLRFRAFRKMGVVCNVDVGAALDVWDLGEPFATGDSVFVFEDRDTTRMNDDRWLRGRVAGGVSPGDAMAGACPDWDEFPVKKLSSPVFASANVRVGAPVRAYESLTYGLYQVDGRWVLGRHGVGEPVVALMGPLAPPAEDGLHLNYYDGDGDKLTPGDATVRKQVERVEIMIRGVAAGAVPGDSIVDPMVTQVHFRGNAWN